MASEPTDGEKRVIKRYSNRKLYDTRDSRYVTLQQIGEMVRRGEDVQIIDNKTKEDKTEVTLALILSEDLKNKPRSVPLGTLRHLIQERGGRVLESLREGPFGRLIPKDREDGEEGAEAPVSEAPPTGDPAVVEAAVAAATEDEEGKKRGRLNAMMESWQATLDERIAAIVPGVAPIRELRAQVKELTERIEELESRAGIEREQENDTNASDE